MRKLKNLDSFSVSIVAIPLLAFASAGASFAGRASAQATPGPKRTEPIENAGVQQSLAERHAGLRTFIQKNGGDWRAHFNERTGAISLMYGTGIPVSASGFGSIEAARAAADAILARFPELWGTELKYLQFESSAKAAGLYVFTWKQQFDGLEVYGARVQIQIHEAGRVAALVAEGVTIPEGFSRTPRLAPEDAEVIVKSNKMMRSADTADVKDFLVFVKGENARAAPALAYRVDVEQPSAENYERVFVDANTGEILSVEPGRYNFNSSSAKHYVADVKGKVEAALNTSLLGTAGPVAGVPLANVRVTVAGVGTTNTDADGNYYLATAQPGPFNVSAQLSGPNFNVVPSQGSALVANATSADVAGIQVADLFFNTSPTELTTSQTTAAYHHSVVRDYVKSELPSFNGYPNQSIFVNINDTCNATFNPSSNAINFFASGGGCVNTAFSTVIYHEYGHGVDDYYGGISSSSLSEALADIVAMYLSGQPVVGQGFFGGNSNIRTGENTTKWPATNCNNQVHCVGETFMGFAWQAYKLLKQSMGAEPGAQHAEKIFLGTLPFDNTSITNAVAQVFILDDNDGNTANGTPHYADLAAAAVMKGFTPPVVTILPITLAHDAHPDTYNQSQPYSIYADVAAVSPQLITSVTLDYNVDGGATQSVVMQPAGAPNQYLAAIPPVVGPKLISYKFRAQDTLNNVITFPPGDSAFRFGVGKKTIIFSSDLESGSAGWMHVQLAVQDDWNWGKPQVLGTNVYDPKTAYSGTNCWGNDLQNQQSNQDGLYKADVNNYLETPSMSASGKTGVRLRFRRWLTVENSTYDFATVHVNGAQVFVNPSGPDLLDSSWTLQDYAAPSANNVSAFKVRWQMDSDGGLQYGGWNIDDVEVYALEATPQYFFQIAAGSNQVLIGNDIVLNMSGSANQTYQLFVSLEPGPGALPGFGVLDCGLATIAFFIEGQLDSAGAGQILLPLPFDPILQGLDLYFTGGVTPSAGLPQIGNTIKIQIQ
ncbi:MAG: hypothetical protein ACKVS6_17345 [Planctomycetota bacterium]